MQTVIIRFSLILFVAAMASFVLALSFNLLHLNSIANLTEYVSVLILLSAFCTILFIGLYSTTYLVLQNIIAYFARTRRLERMLLYNVYTWDRLNRLLYFKKAKIIYINRQKRKKFIEIHARHTDDKFSQKEKRHAFISMFSYLVFNVTDRRHD